MDASIITALSGLTGHYRGPMSGLTTWFSQRAQAKAQWQSQNQLRRQDTYRVFIEQESKLYIEGAPKRSRNISALIGLYAQVSRMRVLSSTSVVESADQIVKKAFPSISSRTRLSRSCRKWLLAA